MSNNYVVVTVIFTILSLAFTIGSITYKQLGSHTRETLAIIKECEKGLPCNQKCVLIAVPEEL